LNIKYPLSGPANGISSEMIAWVNVDFKTGHGIPLLRRVYHFQMSQRHIAKYNCPIFAKGDPYV
jgi:hypothetical protein